MRTGATKAQIDAVQSEVAHAIFYGGSASGIAYRIVNELVPEDARIIGLGLLVRARAALDLMPVRKEIKDELDALIRGDAS